MASELMYRGEDWKDKRLVALERDGFKCRKCGEKTNNVHHIIPWSKSKDNNIKNLITLCDKHHKEEENKYMRYGIVGWMKWQIRFNNETKLKKERRGEQE